MAIIGLTDRGASFPKIGTLRKGGVKVSDRQPGQDLKDHFRLETADQQVGNDFLHIYGEKPNHIRVMLPYATVAENFDTWQEQWAAGALQHRCDGRTCVRWLKPDGTYSGDPRPCPGNCKPAGRLVVWVPELQRAGVILVTTTSIHDIIELQGNLEAAQALRGDLRGIPFILRRSPKKISTPNGDGKRRRMEKWLLSIEPAPDWVRLQLAAAQRAALPSVEVKQLAAPVVDVETGEILEDEDDLFNDPPPPAEVFLTGAVSNIKTWQSNGSARIGFRLDDDLVIVANGLAETWFDLQEGEVLEVTGEWKEHPQKGTYLAPSDIRTVRAPQAEETLL